MDPERIAFVIAQAAMLNAEIAIMQAANSQHPDAQPYGENQFHECIERYGILAQNNCLEYLRNGR